MTIKDKVIKIFKSKTVSKAEIGNLDVEKISLLVGDMQPANRKGAVVKCGGDKLQCKAFSGKVKSTKEGLIFATVYEPDTQDTDNDYAKAESIQAWAHNFIKKGTVGTVDINHNMNADKDFYVAESYILRLEDNEHFKGVKKGAWVVVIKCTNQDNPIWKKGEKDGWNGISLYGREIEEFTVDTSKLEKLVADVKKAVESGNAPKELLEAVSNIESRVAAIEGKDKPETDPNSEHFKSINTSMNEINKILGKGRSKGLTGEQEGELMADTKFTVDGQELVYKSAKDEYYKSFSSVDSGKPMNMILTNKGDLFVDTVVGIADDGTLADISVVPITKDNKIDKGFVDDLILKNSADGTPSAQAVGTGDLEISPQELLAAWSLHENTVLFYKDKYGAQKFGAYVESKLAAKTRRALNRLVLRGDRTTDVARYKGLNGVIKLANDNSDVLDISGTVNDTWEDRLQVALLSMDADLLEDKPSLQIWVSVKDEIRIRREYGLRQTNEGDRLTKDGGKMFFDGIPIKPKGIQDNHIIVGNPKMIILGYREDVKLKIEHKGEDWNYYWYLRTTFGVAYVEDFVKVCEIVNTVPDASAPEFAATYPKVSGTDADSTALAVKTNEDGAAFFVVLADGAAAPSAAQIKAGQDASGSALPASERGYIALTANTEATCTIDALSAETAYDIYVVAVDGNGNTTAVSKVDVTTTA